MPELPEVTTTVNGLQKVLPGLSFTDAWTDLAKRNQTIKQFRNSIKNETFYKKFKKLIIGEKVINVERRAKNILIDISGDHTILIHLKMTGHLLVGKYIFDKKLNGWTPRGDEKSSLFDPYNRFVHVVFSLSNGKHLVMSDARKFGKVTIMKTDEIKDSVHLKGTGPEPLDKSFTFENFKKRIMSKPNSKIKTILMNQSIIAGIGNIYSDEILWEAKIHPLRRAESLNQRRI